MGSLPFPSHSHLITVFQQVQHFPLDIRECVDNGLNRLSESRHSSSPIYTFVIRRNKLFKHFPAPFVEAIFIQLTDYLLVLVFCDCHFVFFVYWWIVLNLLFLRCNVNTRKQQYQMRKAWFHKWVHRLIYFTTKLWWGKDDGL